MMNEKEIQERVNRRLSGLAASQQRRMHIRAAIHAEMEERQPMKRSISKSLVFALVAVMLTGTVALAEHFNLFDFFGAQDERYSAVAPSATLTMTETALVENAHLGAVKASIDSAWFDGLSLTLAYRIDHSSVVTEYTPTPEELAVMQSAEPQEVVLAENAPGREVYAAYNAAVAEGTPFGYRQYTVYPGDHTVTEDGVDIPMYSAVDAYDESGAYCELREFEAPLPAELRDRETLNVSIVLYQQETTVWFDGQKGYLHTERSEVGQMNATIPLTKDAVQHMEGRGTLNGATCTATADVSKMTASISMTCDAPLNTLLTAAPEGTDPYDVWVEVMVVDENGNVFYPQEGLPLNDSTGFTLPFQGTGTLPETLTVYLYSRWEGQDAPDLTEMDGIVLTIKK